MRFLITALVGFLVLPVGALAPTPAEAAQTALAPSLGIDALVAGTYAKEPVFPAPFTARLTAYNAVRSQTDGNPFTTASGAFSNPEVVAARSRDLASTLPFGTIIKVTRTSADTPWCRFSQIEPQVGYRVVADSMNPRISNTVDILLDQHKTVPVYGRLVNPALALGQCGQVSVTVVGHMDVSQIPQTQTELAAYIEKPNEVAIR